MQQSYKLDTPSTPLFDQYIWFATQLNKYISQEDIHQWNGEK